MKTQGETGVLQVAAIAAAGRRIIHMEVGQPGTPAPAGAIMRRSVTGVTS